MERGGGGGGGDGNENGEWEQERSRDVSQWGRQNSRRRRRRLRRPQYSWMTTAAVVSITPFLIPDRRGRSKKRDKKTDDGDKLERFL